MYKQKIFSFIINSFLIFTVHAASHRPEAFLTQITGKTDEGQQIVEHFCINCHGKNPIIPIGAPLIQDENAWKIRLAQGFETIFEHVDNGISTMPARGGCFECSDEHLILAILELIPKNTQKAFLNELKDSKKYKELKKIIKNPKLLPISPDN